MCPGGCSWCSCSGKAPEPAVGGQVGLDPEGMVGEPEHDFRQRVGQSTLEVRAEHFEVT